MEIGFQQPCEIVQNYSYLVYYYLWIYLVQKETGQI